MGAEKVEDVSAGVQALSVDDKAAKPGLGESDYAKEQLAKLTPEIKEKVLGLYAIQNVHDELEQQYMKERFELEAKYQRKYEPLNKERSARVRGASVEHYETKAGDTFASAATATGVPAEQLQADNPEAQEPLPAGLKLVVVKGPAEAAKGIPHFWLKCLQNHPLASEVITDKDAKILECLEDITQKTLPDDKGFTLEFHFGQNTYLSNKVLSKTFHVDKDGSGMFDLEKDEGTVIDWVSDSVNPTQKTMRRKPKPGQKVTGKLETKIVPDNSFFNLFKTKITGDMSEDDPELEDLMEQLEQDYSIGAVVREEILPRAVAWFTGEAAEDYEDYDGEDEDEDDEDEDGEDLDEEEDEGPPRPRRAVQRGRGAGAGDAEALNPECKQQ